MPFLWRVLVLSLALGTLAHGQTLSDVLCSIQERRQAVEQSYQAEAQAGGGSVGDQTLIEWKFFTTRQDFPDQDACNGLSIAQRVGLLNQAITEFENQIGQYLNVDPGQFASGAKIGSLRPYLGGDFPVFPRATPENFHEVLRQLAVSVRKLRVLPWRGMSCTRKVVGVGTSQYEENLYFGNKKVVHAHEDEADVDRDWHPDTISLDSSLVKDQPDSVGPIADESAQVQGGYFEYDVGEEGSTSNPPITLRATDWGLHFYYVSKATMVGSVTGHGGQLTGPIWLLAHQEWTPATQFTGPQGADRENGEFEIIGGGQPSGEINVATQSAAMSVDGEWVDAAELYPPDEFHSLATYFIPDGFDSLKESLNSGDPADAGKNYDSMFGASPPVTGGLSSLVLYAKSYHAVKLPTFTRGVDATTVAGAWTSVEQMAVATGADGAVLLHPRSEILMGIDLGAGLKGGSGLLGVGVGWTGNYAQQMNDPWDQRAWALPGPAVSSPPYPIQYYDTYYYNFRFCRFDFGSMLRLVGSASDFHVVYSTGRDADERGAAMPDWEFTSQQADDRGWGDMGKAGFFAAWDVPRVRQIAGAELVADIKTLGPHKQEVTIYRMTPGARASLNRDAGHLVPVANLPKVRTLTVRSTNHSGEWFIEGPEDLTVEETNGPTYQVKASSLDEEGTLDFTINGGTGQGSYRKKITITSNVLGGSYDSEEWIDGQALGKFQAIGTTWRSTGHWTSATWTPTGAAAVTMSAEGPSNSGDLPLFQYYRYPKLLTINDPDAPTATTTWNEGDGCFHSFSQAPWYSESSYSTAVATTDLKLSNAIYGRTWIEQLDSGLATRVYSAPDGNAGKTDGPTGYREIEYGAGNGAGYPGLPRAVRSKDGTGTVYTWTLQSDRSFTCTTKSGKLSTSDTYAVSRGSESSTAVNASGYTTSSTVSSAVGGGLLQVAGSTVPTNEFSAWGAPKKVKDYNTDLISSWDFKSNRDLIASATDALGVQTNGITYDSLDRPTAYTWNGVAGTTSYNADASLGVSTGLSVTGRAHSSLSKVDGRGRPTQGNSSAAGAGSSWSNTYSATNNSSTFTDLLSGATAVNTTLASDGSLVTGAGTSVPFGGSEGQALAVDGGLLKSRVQVNGLAAAYQTVWTDAWGRTRKVETPSTTGSGGDTTEYQYSPPTERSSSNDPMSRVVVIHSSGRHFITESEPYDASGAIARSGIDMSSSGNPNGILGAGDRYAKSVTSISSGKLVTTVSRTDNNGDPDGFRQVQRSEWTPHGNAIAVSANADDETVTSTPDYTARTVDESSSKGWSVSTNMTKLWQPASSTASGTGVATTTTTSTRREDGSTASVVVNEAGDTSTANIGPDGQLTNLIVPILGEVFGGHSFSSANKTETVTINGTTLVRKYDGSQQTLSGNDVMQQDRQIAKAGSGFAETIHPLADGSDTTRVTNAAMAKTGHVYAANTGSASTISSEWYAGGLPSKLGRARGGQVEFGYSTDGAKDLTSVTWPSVTAGVFGSVTPTPVTMSYDAAGRLDTVTDASGARSLDYQKGYLWKTDYTAGSLDDYYVERTHDDGRLKDVILKKGGTEIHRFSYSYNGNSNEVSGVGSGGFAAGFDRNAGRYITAVHRGGVDQTWGRGVAGRIESAGNNVSGAPTFSYTEFDGKGRRKKCVTGGATWNYTYGTAGQLTSATHTNYGNFSYTFDGIGRRTDQGNGSDLFNRFMTMSNPQHKKLLIAADPDARLWVNGVEKTPFNGGWVHELDSPGTGGGWVPWNVRAVLEGAGDPAAYANAEAELNGYAWVPPAAESFTYDTDGNRLSSAQWDYGWDGRNRLVFAKTKNYSTSPEGWELGFDYDAEGRRFKKTVKHKTTSPSSVVTETTTNVTFVWDGWNLIYERHEKPDHSLILERSYVWGPDIAGGAGGLLLMRESRGQVTQSYYPLYDGSGHVTALADSAGKLVAKYAYGPFGELASVSGPMADANPWRYATKYFDAETGLYYFGHRYYDPVTGQWLSRELLGEDESLNLYAYCHNDPVNKIDVLGLGEQVLVPGCMDPVSAGFFVFRGFGQSNGIIPDLIQNKLVAPMVQSARTWGTVESIVSDHLSGVARSSDSNVVAGLAYTGGFLVGLHAEGNEIAGNLLDNKSAGADRLYALTETLSDDGEFGAWDTTQVVALGFTEMMTPVVEFEQMSEGTSLVDGHQFSSSEEGWNTYGAWMKTAGLVTPFASVEAESASMVSGKLSMGSRVGLGVVVDDVATETIGTFRSPKTPPPVHVDGPPGFVGEVIPRRLTNAEMWDLSQELGGIELSQQYRIGPGANGGGGHTWLFSGEVGEVRVQNGPQWRHISHVHPDGVPMPSDWDMDLLRAAQQAGSPQQSSVIITGRNSFVKWNNKGVVPPGAKRPKIKGKK